jgi:hypothetical protein
MSVGSRELRDQPCVRGWGAGCGRLRLRRDPELGRNEGRRERGFGRIREDYKFGRVVEQAALVRAQRVRQGGPVVFNDHGDCGSLTDPVKIWRGDWIFAPKMPIQ